MSSQTNCNIFSPMQKSNQPNNFQLFNKDAIASEANDDNTVSSPNKKSNFKVDLGFSTTLKNVKF